MKPTATIQVDILITQSCSCQINAQDLFSKTKEQAREKDFHQVLSKNGFLHIYEKNLEAIVLQGGVEVEQVFGML